MSAVTLDEVRVAAEKFVGDIEQIPPMVSAVKVGGKRLHQLAREGIEVERKPRPVTIHSIDVSPTDETHVFTLSVVCSSGTYIRTLAADIGETLHGGAHLRRLRRVAIGSFTLHQAVSLEQMENDWKPHLLDAAAMVGHLPSFVADSETKERICHGKSLPGRAGDEPWAVMDDAGELLAVYIGEQQGLRPDVVLCAG